MLYELARTIVQKILQDKILLGLVVIGILGLFIGGATMGGGPDRSSTRYSRSEEPASPAQNPNAVQPQLAADFVKWWLTAAMDYKTTSAAASHNEALGWMTPEGARDFTTMLWTPRIAEAVSTGRVVAAFQPTGVEAQAVNPDGSVVVGVTGTVVIQGQGQPIVNQFLGNFLVKKERDGLRIARLYTRQAPLALY